MSRYRSNRLPAASGHAVGIEEAVNDFLLHRQRKGDSESYLRELRSYLAPRREPPETTEKPITTYFPLSLIWCMSIRWVPTRHTGP
jgi:hypothetical protein